MKAESIKEVLDATPFRPVRLVMSDGKTFDIDHPEVVVVSRDRLVIGQGVDEHGIVDHFVHCSLIHVTRIEEPKAA